jgi:serine protease Do
MAVPPANSGPLTGPVDAGTFRNIAKAQNGVVVNIRTESRRPTQNLTDFFGGGGGGNTDLFRRFFGMPDDQGGQGQGQGQSGQGQGRGRRQQAPQEQVLESAGSGFIISKDGFILTNNHVVEGASVIKVALYSEDSFDTTEWDAKLIGRDPLTDSALIQLVGKPPHALAEAKFGDSSLMQPGDWVMAIGNPFALSHTVTVGVISANRPGGLPITEGRAQDVLQTDAAINPGNSGGPLLNIRGEVIGINTAILSNGGQSGNVGIGFAIPINIVRDILPQLRAGKVIRGRIGVQLSPDIPSDATAQFGLKAGFRGALVSIVEPNGPGGKAGLQPGDVIAEYNGQPIKNRDQLIRLVTATKPGTTVPLRVLRDKQEKSLNITIEELDLEAETGATRPPEETQPEDTGTSAWGMRLQNVTPDIARRLRLPSGRTGVVIMDVDPYSAADRSRLAAGDVILEINRTPIKDRTQAVQLLQKVPDGTRVGFLIWRAGQETFVLGRKE